MVIGLAIMVAMLATAILIVALNRIIEATRDTYLIVGIFYEAPRLRVGSVVRLAGYPVGEVTRIELLPPNHESIPPFAATLRIPTRFRGEIRRDSGIRLVRQRLLGEPVVELRPGTLGSLVLQPGDTLRARPPIRPATLAAMASAARASFDTLVAEGQVLRAEFQATAELRERIRVNLERAQVELMAFERQLEEGPLAEFLADSAWRLSLARIERELGAIADAARARARTVRDAEYGAALAELIRRAEEVADRIAALRALLNATSGFPWRWEADPALRQAIATTRAHLDSLIEVTRRKPWRYFF